jgi:hypothetical protein
MILYSQMSGGCKLCFMLASPNMNYCKIVLYLHMGFQAVLKLAFLQQFKLNSTD